MSRKRPPQKTRPKLVDRRALDERVRDILSGAVRGLIMDSLGLGGSFHEFEIDVCRNVTAAKTFCDTVKTRPDVMAVISGFIRTVVDADQAVMKKTEKKFESVREYNPTRHDPHSFARVKSVTEEARRQARQRAWDWARADAQAILADIHHAVQEKIRASV